uniref:Putative secreted histamine binding protein of 20.0 kDa n=2 Tax=Ixodes ricinus TaxID=34613 RepID=V5HBY1_IXORI
MQLHFGLIGSTVLLPSTLLTLINILSNKSRMSTNLFLKSHTFYLLYRSEKSDTKLGGESKCFQMRYYEAGRGKEEFLTQLLFRDNSTGQMDVYSIVIVLEKSNESLKYYDRLVAQNHIATRYEIYDLLYTDYHTCFTLRRISRTNPF